jgi:cytochrome c553
MLRRVLKWLAIGLAAILVLALVALVYAYVASSRIIDRTYDVPLAVLAASSDSAVLADGQRLASLWGCLVGCHGEDGAGTLMFEQPLVGRIRAPNITTILPDYTDEELERLIRRGVKQDGRSVFVMPSGFLYHLDDAQLNSIIAHVRSLPKKKDRFKGGVKFGPMGRATGCSECHGEDLRGEDGFTPSLEVVATSYTPADFRLLMRTGIALGGRQLDLMSEVARDNLRHLTPREVAGLYDYLTGHFAANSAVDE